MAHLERTLFENPRSTRSGERGDGRRRRAADVAISSSAACPSSPLRSALDIEILAAARQVGEIELIAGRIKRLLVDGEARPGEIAVVFRSPQDPASWSTRSSAGWAFPSCSSRARRSIVRRRCGRWPRCCNSTSTTGRSIGCWPCWGATTFSPTGPSGATRRVAAVERTIRELQIPRGRELLIEQLAAVGGDSSRRSASGDASYNGSTLAVVQTSGRRVRCFAATGDAARMGQSLAAIGRARRACCGRSDDERARA